jgi:integrase
MHREGMRRSEAVRLTWVDVDLERSVVRLDENKTDHPRWWKLAPGVAEALMAWRGLRGDVAPTDLVFLEPDTDGIDVDHLAACVRRHLLAAEIRRHELHEKRVNSGRFNAHCFRHSFVTRSLAIGHTEDWVRQRTGHRSVAPSPSLGLLRDPWSQSRTTRVTLAPHRVHDGPISAFTMPRNGRSRGRSRCSRCSDLSVHDAPIPLFTMGQFPH